MTAEIAIMNKTAIALAADSAVTIVGQKVYNTVNKLFTLSKYHPVGIMVYGNAELMGIPWESIIKIYRKKLGKQRFDNLREYANHFIEFLDSENQLFSNLIQSKFILANVGGYFTLIREEIDREIKAISQKECVSETQIKKVVADIIEKHFKQWDAFEKLQHFPDRHLNEILDKYGQEIGKAKEDVFEKLPLSESNQKKLEYIAAYLFYKNNFPPSISGIVIAGFGETDIFPGLIEYHIELVVNNRLKYKTGQKMNIGFDNAAAIVPFAQREMVDTFMQGIDPFYQHALDGYLTGLFNKYPDHIVSAIVDINDKEKKELTIKLQAVSDQLLEDFKKKTETYRTQRHIMPVINAVSALPKDELAAMAESLVNLTSFKRKITLEIETVGGPIDVAVISKGDGFVWIKRKHYFNAELNHHFRANYYIEDGEGTKNENN